MKINICPKIRAIIDGCDETRSLNRYIDNLSVEEMLLLLSIEYRRTTYKKNREESYGSGQDNLWYDKIRQVEQVQDQIEQLINKREAR